MIQHSTSAYQSEGNENANLKRYLYPLAALFTIAKTQMQPKCPLTEEQIRKCIHILFSHKQEKNLAICTNMNRL